MRSTQLLREYVSMLLIEKIKSRKNVKSELGSSFNINKFKSLPTIEAMNTYADEFLDMLGQGSSRAGYLMTSRFVLKIAINEKGLSQNKVEIDISTNPSTKEVVAKVKDYDKDGKWIISELVKELKNEKEFETITGENFQSFMSTLKDAMHNKKELPDDASDLLRSTYELTKTSDMLFGDIKRPEHWGKTPDGRCVLLDYGLVKDVWDTHYKKTKIKQDGADPFEQTVDPVGITKFASKKNDSTLEDKDDQATPTPKTVPRKK